jgi:hypothetical protein
MNRSPLRGVSTEKGLNRTDSPKAGRRVGWSEGLWDYTEGLHCGITYGIILWDQIGKGRNDFSFLLLEFHFLLSCKAEGLNFLCHRYWLLAGSWT